MTYEASERAAFRMRLLTRPGERQDVDYKASLAFLGNDSFSLKLIRHVQGMANSGGGWLVIGFLETNQGLIPDPKHAQEICASYDPTPLSQAIDKRVEQGQQIKVTVYFETLATTQLKYPIVQVDGFERVPYISRSNVNASDTGVQILRQGAVYIRRPGSETVEVSSRSDWGGIDQSVCEIEARRVSR